MTDAELLTVYDDAAPLPDDHLAALRAVERAARAAEREACARVCEETTAAWRRLAYNSACMDCATAIRNRSEGQR